MPKIIYISGPMTGLDNANREAFFSAEDRLKANGFVVMNPAVNPDGLSYEQYMRVDIAMLAVCNCIYMLKGHQKSKGAMAELMYARCVGFTEYYEHSGHYINKKELCNDDI